MRLTKKDLDMLDTTSVYSKAQHKAICEQAIKECYEYKCIEEELGIDLATLFKALSNGIWVKFAGEKPYHVKAPISLKGIDIAGQVFHFTLCYPISYNTIQELLLKDYGKTWALTKEELE